MTTEPIDHFANYPDHRPYGQKPPEPPFDLEKASENCALPLPSAAYSLLKLEEPSRELDTALAEKALERQAERIRDNDFSTVEQMLSAQVQVLHKVFTQSVGEFAKTNWQNSNRGYGNIALKAQSYCRMTVDAITRLKMGQKELERKQKIEDPAIKETGSGAEPFAEAGKNADPAIKEAAHAAMD